MPNYPAEARFVCHLPEEPLGKSSSSYCVIWLLQQMLVKLSFLISSAVQYISNSSSSSSSSIAELDLSVEAVSSNSRRRNGLEKGVLYTL